MHKRNGTYYYTYCNRFEVGAAICETNSNPTNLFVPQGVVLANPPQNVNNNNHHSIVSYGTNCTSSITIAPPPWRTGFPTVTRLQAQPVH